jgi:hypothetical protein
MELRAKLNYVGRRISSTPSTRRLLRARLWQPLYFSYYLIAEHSYGGGITCGNIPRALANFQSHDSQWGTCGCHRWERWLLSRSARPKRLALEQFRHYEQCRKSFSDDPMSRTWKLWRWIFSAPGISLTEVLFFVWDSWQEITNELVGLQWNSVIIIPLQSTSVSLYTNSCQRRQKKT